MHPLNQPEVMIAAAHDKFDAQGNLVDTATKELIRKQLARLVEWGRRLESGRPAGAA
jgi:chromate reductase